MPDLFEEWVQRTQAMERQRSKQKETQETFSGFGSTENLEDAFDMWCEYVVFMNQTPDEQREAMDA